MEIKVFAKGRGNSYIAEGVFAEKSFIVCKGSQISPSVSDRVLPVVLKKRQNRELVSESGEVLKDIKFRSPSTAASFVSGSITNGNRLWKDKNGIKLAELRRRHSNGED